MQSFLINAVALAASVGAMPSHHRRSHDHAHARRINYDVSNVDWSKLDWAAIFGNSDSTTTTTQAAATATTATAVDAQTSSEASATTTTTAAVSTASASSSSSTGKRGVAWDQGTDASLASLFEVDTQYWIYNWASTLSFTSSLQYMPMIKTADDVDELSSVPSGSTVLGFNEPDQQGLSAADAAALYKASFTPLRTSGAIGRLVSPAITNGDSGLPWLEEFMEACSDCAIDALAVHFYGPTLAMLETQMAAIHAAFPSMTLLVTEVGCTNWSEASNPTAAEVSQFMTDAITWFEATDYIERYAFFAAMPITDVDLGVANSLLTGASAGSSLTDQGTKYTS